MADFTYTLNGEPLEYGAFRTPDGTLHLAYVLDLWPDDELATIGVIRTAVVPPPPPSPSLDELKAAKQQAVRDLRWQKETSGVTVNGTPIRTDEKSQAKLNGAVSLFQLDPNMTQIDSWEAVPGLFVTLSREQVMGIALAVGAHVQACFTRSKELCEAVAAAADADALDGIDITAGWPS